MESIAFDFDGTLIDISKRDYRVYVDILKKYNCKYLEYDKYWNLRLSKTNIFDVLRLTIDDELVLNNYIRDRDLLIEKPNYLDLDELLDGVVEILTLLSKRFSLYLVTKRKSGIDTNNQLKKIGIFDFFVKIVITNQSKYDAFVMIPNLRYVVGDTENDILPANRLGVKSIAILTGIRNEDFLKSCKPNKIIESLNQLNEILNSND